MSKYFKGECEVLETIEDAESFGIEIEVEESKI